MIFYRGSLRIAAFLLVAVQWPGFASAKEAAAFRIAVVDAENGWAVPMVELRTNHEVKFYTDNAGVVAFDLPELMGRETWFAVTSDGYEVPADGFGRRGVRITPRAGGKHTVRMNRTSIAKRLGRITGAGIFGESQKLGEHRDWRETHVLGQDSVQNAVHRGRLFWAWGDTTLSHYPLGIFHMTGATTSLRPIADWTPPLRLKLNYFRDERGELRGIAQMPGEGPTWLSGLVSLPDKSGKRRLVASYVKIEGTLTGYEAGLCVWNDSSNNFEHLATIWKRSAESQKAPRMPTGHAVVLHSGEQNAKALFGSPFPALQCDATYEAWKDPQRWELLEPTTELRAAAGGAVVKPHAGAIAWNQHRGRWVTVFHEAFGKPSFLGEVWYAEADAPTGPWGPAVKVLSHAKHSFYNVQLHPELVPDESPMLLFEGTYTMLFTDAVATPRYEYNQLMYRLDLADPKLAPAQTK